MGSGLLCVTASQLTCVVDCAFVVFVCWSSSSLYSSLWSDRTGKGLCVVVYKICSVCMFSCTSVGKRRQCFFVGIFA